jgi:hypothetical protein
MLHTYIANLQNSIIWAQHQDDIDVLYLARDNMNQLLNFITTLPEALQTQAHQTIDNVLPMEWPMWMEACRYEDFESCVATSEVFH